LSISIKSIYFQEIFQLINQFRLKKIVHSWITAIRRSVSQIV